MTVWSGNTLFAVNKDLDSRQGVMHFCVKGNVTHQIAIRKAAEAYTQVTTRQVNEIVEAIRDLQRSGEEERKTAAQEWNNKIAELLLTTMICGRKPESLPSSKRICSGQRLEAHWFSGSFWKGC